MSRATTSTAGILLVVVPTVIYGGVSLLGFLQRKTHGYVDNPLRQNFFRAGHAHAGVLIIFALVAMPYLEYADLASGLESLARTCMVAAPILMPLGFFFSVVRPDATKPNRLILLTYLGAVSLAVGTVTIGVGLLGA